MFKVILFDTINLFTKHVSSVYNRGAKLDVLFISLMYKVNSGGPRTER